MRIYTAQIGRGGSGLILDTTVKSGAGLGKVLAPTWDIVLGVKKGHLSPAEYEVIYLNLLRERFKRSKEAFLEILAQEECTLACYCRSGAFCHRHLAVNVLEKIAAHYGIPFERGGEVTK
jgi:hypothetical protein